MTYNVIEKKFHQNSCNSSTKVLYLSNIYFDVCIAKNIQVFFYEKLPVVNNRILITAADYFATLVNVIMIIASQMDFKRSIGKVGQGGRSY